VSQWPRCSQGEEGEAHILCCPADSAKQCWITAVNQLKIWLQQEKMDPQLVEVIVGRLQWWYLGEDL